MTALRQITEIASPGATPRICMPSSRNLTKKAFQSGVYEAQDVLQEMDDVDMVCLTPGPGFRFRSAWQRRLLFRDSAKFLISFNPGLEEVRLTRDYDLFVAVCQNHWDLAYLNAIRGWKDHTKVSVLWIDEMWAAQIPQYKNWFPAIRQFDHIFVGCRGSVEALSKALDRPCHWLPAATDTLRFSPYANSPAARVIDVYSIGRRYGGMHDALCCEAQQGKIFYIYDTFAGADAELYDTKQHRNLYANMAKRSRYFVVAPAKMNNPSDTQGQIEFGSRYYEGAAAGCVLIGKRPDSEAFSEMFPGPDSVISVQPDGSDIVEILARLNSEPERIAEISRRNSVQSLLKHDWVRRWKEIFDAAGMEPSPRMLARECRLKELADVATGVPVRNLRYAK
jgi:hypothetical protein